MVSYAGPGLEMTSDECGGVGLDGDAHGNLHGHWHGHDLHDLSLEPCQNENDTSYGSRGMDTALYAHGYPARQSTSTPGKERGYSR